MSARPGLGDSLLRLLPPVALGSYALLVLGVLVALAATVPPLEVLAGLASAELLAALGLSLGASLLATAGALALGLPAAWLLARRRFPGRAVLDTLVDLPVALPPLVIGVGLLLLFGPLLGDGLAALGLRVVFHPLGVVIAQFTVATPLVIRASRATFEAVDPRQAFMARSLGATRWQAFRLVTLPQARRGILAAVVLGWSRALGEFGATVMLAGATAFRTETLPTAVFLHVSTGDTATAVAAALIMVLVAVLTLGVLKLAGNGRGVE